MLGLENPARAEDFDKLCDNIDPRTGQKLRPLAREGERVGMDLTFNATKSVSLARELAGPDNAGDPRIEEAHREAVRYVMEKIESEIQTRVRGGRDGDRVTGNMVAWHVTHRDTRINADDQHPDMSLHSHVFVLNTTYDHVEDKWKACQMGQIKHDAPYFESLYHNRLASNLKDLGYGIRRDAKAFEINGISRETIEKFSRRREYIKAVADKLGITSQKGMDKLGATTRLGKTKELADDLNGYYVSRLTDKEKQQFTSLIGQPSYQSNEEKAVQYAIAHEFYTKSVVEERKLYETAIRHGIGSMTPEAIQAEARKQGVLLKDGQATTKAVLAEESRIIDFAREGKGTMRPMGSPVENRTNTATLPTLSQQKGRPDESKRPLDHMNGESGLKLHKQLHRSGSDESVGVQANTATLSPEQQAMVSHVLKSTDRVVLVIGDAGTGKTRSIKSAFQEIDRPIEMLAPSADASRGVLRDEGFSKADTVASFLMDEKRQAGVKNGVLWIDEAGLLAIKDLSRLTEIAKQQNARIVLQGDPKQHRSVVRHGNMMNVLQEYAGLPVGRLTEIWRQQHKGYKAVVSDIASGKSADGFDKLNDLGWVKHVEGNTPLVDDYFEALRTKKSDQAEKDRVIIIAPTHLEGQEITAEIRNRLKDEGKLKDEKTFDQLVPLNWTEAERGDVERYDGTEVMQFHRNSGTFKAGQVVKVSEWKKGDHFKSAEHFSVYRPQKTSLAAGDQVRFTANGKTLDDHKLNNGSVYKIKGFDKKDNIILDNGWTVGKNFRHLSHGYVSTSHASQGKTVDKVLVAMGSESRGAINAEQFYVSVSRGREATKIYTDMAAAELRDVIQKTDSRKSATELMKPKPKPKRQGMVRSFLKKARERFKSLQAGLVGDTREKTREKERAYAGQER